MQDWIKWNGVHSGSLGIVVLNQPVKVTAVERVNSTTVPGRSGSLTFYEGDNVYDDINLSCTCVIQDDTRINDITSCFKGEGTLELASQPYGYYKARFSNQISFDKVLRGNPHRTFSLNFVCKPFFYLNSGLTPITATMSAGSTSGIITLKNPGTLPSQPIITLTRSSESSGDGHVDFSIGTGSMSIDGLDESSYIILDCEAKVAYKGERGSASDPLTLLSHRVTYGKWATIPVGTSYMQFTGDVETVGIIPRWRTL